MENDNSVCRTSRSRVAEKVRNTSDLMSYLREHSVQLYREYNIVNF